MDHQLTTGAIVKMLNGEKVDNAVLQVISHKRVVGDTERYRLLISDGQHMNSFAMLGTQLVYMIHENQLAPNTVFRLNRYVSNTVNGTKKIIILLDITVLVPGAQTGKIGNPQAYAAGSTPAPAAAAPAPAAPAPAPAFKNSTSNGAMAARPVAAPPAATGQLSAQNVMPIAHLTPYANKWTIKARVTSKSDIRTWSNARGEGKLFSFELLDESGEIRCTAFKEQCDKFYDFLEPNKVYYLSQAFLKPANKQFCGTIQHDFELTLNHNSIIEPCMDDSSIPGMQFNFVPISDLQTMEKTGLVDVIGVCKEAGDLDRIMSRKLSKELTKRDLKLVDQSNTEVTLTLWGSQAESFDAAGNPVVAIKGARLSDFNGCSLSSGGNSKLQLNPDIDQTYKLKGWYENEGVNMESKSISTRAARPDNFKTFAQAKHENIGGTGEPGYYSVCATILQLRSENCLYQSCPNGDCKKKVIDQQNGTFRCEKCNEQFSEFRWRALMQMNVADMTDNQWVTAFQETAEAVLGISADELGRMRDSDPERFQAVFNRATFKQFNMKLRAKMESYNDESRMRVVVSAAAPVSADLEAHKRRLREEIIAMGGQPNEEKMVVD
ncbi:replication protein A 70 kDa DNA-binding subunit-like [Amphibalanus amphitrite]|uniref:replication protein A 70 kDa DNA-binding subunit-like n=1 Tax=Amphibalanus amphitrite TaxID=1232801 RepID=UPI001C91B30C|nr:replication protein A 70 kDa DNA-binding subunit-like [Amphibalanus amphitrite]